MMNSSGQQESSTQGAPPSSFDFSRGRRSTATKAALFFCCILVATQLRYPKGIMTYSILAQDVAGQEQIHTLTKIEVSQVQPMISQLPPTDAPTMTLAADQEQVHTPTNNRMQKIPQNPPTEAPSITHGINSSIPDSQDQDENEGCPLRPCNLSIVFMGDSLTRFMYYSLVYFLRHNNTWIDADDQPNLVKPADFLGGYELNFDWMPWYNASNAALAPYESCDCYREKGSITRGAGSQVVSENRYFYDPNRNNTVIHFQAYGHHIPVRGHYPIPAVFRRDDWKQNKANNVSYVLDDNAIQHPSGPYHDRQPFQWSMPWADAIRTLIPQLRPDVLILNAGLWTNHFDKPEYVEDTLAAIQLISTHTRTLWKTTTPGKHGKYPTQQAETDAKMCQLLSSVGSTQAKNYSVDPPSNASYGGGYNGEHCLNVTGWLQSVDVKYYIDANHYREPMYRMMNEQLLISSLGVEMPLNYQALKLASLA